MSSLQQFPEDIRDIIHAAAVENLDDIRAAVSQAEERCRSSANWQSVIDVMVDRAITEAVYDVRHALNTARKRSQGTYGGLSKVDPACPAVIEVYKSYYAHCIDGRTLGSLLGKEWNLNWIEV